MTQLQMKSGEYVWPYEPWLFTPRIDDIAWHLSGIYRFTGLTRLTVAQHSCLVADNVPEKDRLWALLHDAPEAYVGDMASPLKHANTPHAKARRDDEQRLMERICDTFGLSQSEPKSVRQADARMAVTERRDLLPDDPHWRERPGWAVLADVEPYEFRIVEWGPTAACYRFLTRYAELAQAVAA